jgi:hypothetical protein
MKLRDQDKVVVVGGGPAGAFFAIHFLRLAKLRGLKAEVVIIEKKGDAGSGDGQPHSSCREGCNYCAGGLSPKLAAALEEEGLSLPEDIIAGTIRSLTIHGHWKNIELRVPEDKRMYAVFRGSRPKGRANQDKNFDSFLLEKARQRGAEIVFGEVCDLRYSATSNPIVLFRPQGGAGRSRPAAEGQGGAGDEGLQAIEAGFLVLAGGVNQWLGRPIGRDPFWQVVRRAVPGYFPPKVRRALISEVEIQKEMEAFLEGEIYFVEFGSKTLKIEMSSLIPKGRYITAALLGRSVDTTRGADNLALIKAYLNCLRSRDPSARSGGPACLHVRSQHDGQGGLACGENGPRRGDMAGPGFTRTDLLPISRPPLARAVLEAGVDRKSLGAAYGPVIKALKRDNGFGQILFMLNRLVFSNPTLSRILYQAVLTERKTKPERARRLAHTMWKMASGDDTYRAGLRAMFNPLAVWSIFSGGLVLTLRNFLTEYFFGLRWRRLGRYPTGLHKEDMEVKRERLLKIGRPGFGPGGPAFESMYSITIKSTPDKIFRHLGTFGDGNREYFEPAGEGGQGQRRARAGCLIRYETPSSFLISGHVGAPGGRGIPGLQGEEWFCGGRNHDF